MAFYQEVMGINQQRVLRQVAAFTNERAFYLGGGTAVAIQLGHRRSVDLDWFTPGKISDPLSLARDLQEAGIPFNVTDVDKGTLHGTVRGVRLSFLEYGYPHLFPPVDWPEYQIRLATLEDLACMKLSAIGGRGAKKDFIDIYALGTNGLALPQMLDFYRRRYKADDLGHTVFALTYFDDAENEATPKMLWSVGWQEIKSTIEDWVREYVQEQAPPRETDKGIIP